MQIDAIAKYLASPVQMPYFLFVGDDQYGSITDELSFQGIDSVQLSSFCNEDDKLPDIDKLFNVIQDPMANGKGKKIVVKGLGEFLALQGSHEASNILFRLKDLNVADAKVVLLLRGVTSKIPELQTDLRFDDRRFCIIGKPECDLSFTLYPPSVGFSDLPSFKAMLEKLENGHCGSVVVSTSAVLNNSQFTVKRISNAYERIKFFTKGFSSAQSSGTDAQWGTLLTELNQKNGSLGEVFENYGFDSNLDSNFYTRISRKDFRSWLYFIFLKSRISTLQNGYLQFVLDKTECFDDFSSNILNSIIDLPQTDKRFLRFYQERKVLVEKFPEPDILSFVRNNRKDITESVFKLTDNTIGERQEIIAWVSKNRLIPQLDDIYPALSDYLKKYNFRYFEPDLAVLLTDYFEAYKHQKLLNTLEPDFLGKVDEYARHRKYNRLPTRNVILDKVNKESTFLYWLDALGVEYLSFIEALVQKRGLSIKIFIARAELPTITLFNSDFFERWQGRKEKNDELDETKHKSNGGYDFINEELPIHLAKELDIIENVINHAVTELVAGHCKRFLIVSDHGASRLAVLRKKEEKYPTDTKGENSGRCCPLFHPYDLPFAAEENGYLVLADYGRFAGSRAANVEVHGGASLEEVVVPIIELSLKKSEIKVELVSDSVTVDPRIGAEIVLFFNTPSVQNVSVVMNDKRYLASQTDAQHFSVSIPDIKRAGDYAADVYSGDNLIGKIVIKAQGRSGNVKSDFDSLF